MLKQGIDRQHHESTENLQRMKAMAKQAIQDIDQQKSLLEAAEAAEKEMDALVEMLHRQQTQIAQLKDELSHMNKQKFGTENNTIAYFVSKYAQHFPKFDAHIAESNLAYWEDYWDRIEAFRKMTNCPDDTLAYLIKDTATPGTALGQALQDIDFMGRPGHTSIQQFGLQGIKDRMAESFAPDDMVASRETRQTYENCHRKFKEKPISFFRRF